MIIEITYKITRPKKKYLFFYHLIILLIQAKKSKHTTEPMLMGTKQTNIIISRLKGPQHGPNLQRNPTLAHSHHPIDTILTMTTPHA